jgi:hypothetical protein
MPANDLATLFETNPNSAGYMIGQQNRADLDTQAAKQQLDLGQAYHQYALGDSEKAMLPYNQRFKAGEAANQEALAGYHKNMGDWVGPQAEAEIEYKKAEAAVKQLTVADAVVSKYVGSMTPYLTQGQNSVMTGPGGTTPAGGSNLLFEQAKQKYAQNIDPQEANILTKSSVWNASPDQLPTIAKGIGDARDAMSGKLQEMQAKMAETKETADAHRYAANAMERSRIYQANMRAAAAHKTLDDMWSSGKLGPQDALSVAQRAVDEVGQGDNQPLISLWNKRLETAKAMDRADTEKKRAIAAAQGMGKGDAVTNELGRIAPTDIKNWNITPSGVPFRVVP